MTSRLRAFAAAVRERWPQLLAALFGFAWFLLIGGAPSLDPRNVSWIPGSDWMQHWLGWQMFRGEPWHFPLGTISAMPYPVGTTVGFTDSNPLVSLLLKPFSGVMPADVQFIGPWLALCFILQGYFGALLATVATDDRRQQFLGGCLFALSPVLAARIGHDTLCAHWLLLLLLYLGLRDYAGQADAAAPDAAVRRSIWVAVAAVALAASIHPYLTAMTWLLAQAFYVRLWRARLTTLARTAIASVVTTGAVVVVFGAIGYLGGGVGMASPDFGRYNADLLALLAPAGYSRLLAFLPAPRLAWEGVGYLGVGALALCAVAAIAWIRARSVPRPGTWVIVAAAGVMALYALSVQVRFADHVVLTLKGFYGHFAGLVGAFRSSGRFIWPLHYLLLVFGVWGATRLAGSRRHAAAVGTAVLAVAVVLQILDVKLDPAWSAAKNFRRAPAAEFGFAAGRYDHLALFPMQVMGVCGKWEEDYAFRYMLLAQQLRMTYNSGIFARLPADKVRAECARMDRDVLAGRLEPRTLYVVHRFSIDFFQKAGAACGRFDGEWFCVSGDSDEVVRAIFRK